MSIEYDCFEAAPLVALLSATAFLHDIKADGTLILEVHERISANVLPGTTEKADNNNSVMIIILQCSHTCESIEGLHKTTSDLGKPDVEHMRAQNLHFGLDHLMRFQGNNCVLAAEPSAYTCLLLQTRHARN